MIMAIGTAARKVISNDNASVFGVVGSGPGEAHCFRSIVGWQPARTEDLGNVIDFIVC